MHSDWMPYSLLHDIYDMLIIYEGCAPEWVWAESEVASVQLSGEKGSRERLNFGR